MELKVTKGGTYVINRVPHIQGNFAKGDIIKEVHPECAKDLIKWGVAVDASMPEPVVEEGFDLETASKKELMDKCVELGIEPVGKKEELKEKIVEAEKMVNAAPENKAFTTFGKNKSA